MAALAAAYAWHWRIGRTGERPPVREKLLRPPGESLRLKIDELAAKLGESIALTFSVPAVTMVAVLLSARAGALTQGRAALAFVAGAGLLVVFLSRLFRIASELRDYRLGFHGERAVGEELNQLMREGCQVFHDVPLEPYGNIDHVIVAPAGVFAVETKTRRKRPAPKGKREYDAVFEGEGVKFPTWHETDMVEQARMQADKLRAFLSKAVGEPVDVSPILTLPGWYVTSRVPFDSLYVLNPRQIAGIVNHTNEGRLDPTMIKRIAYQLEQKCRDVEL